MVSGHRVGPDGNRSDGSPKFALVPHPEVCARAHRLIQDRQLEQAKISNQQSSINNHQSHCLRAGAGRIP
jgi:hypothetical protein